MNSEALYQAYVTKMHRIADIRHASAVLQWDQETYLPTKSAAIRGQQISTLAEMSHELFSEAALGDLLHELQQRQDLNAAQKRNVALTLEDYEKNKKYSSAFVRALSEQVNKTFHCWMEARKQNSFAIYKKDLEQLLALKKEEAGMLGYTDHPYNAHLNEYEKGATVAQLDGVFAALLPTIKNLLDQVMARPQVDDRFLRQHFPKNEQWAWSMELIRLLHFDTEAGRQDLSEHPFSISFHPQDVRITTRVDEDDFSNMTWSCIHEVGHALYEQGLPAAAYGLPLGEACSYTIHESQSRLWENNVGRSLGFWQHHYPALQNRFPQQFGQVGLTDFYKGINKVQPSLIRTEADELTYHFHVYIRYELEKQLLAGQMLTADIPEFWALKYRELLHVTVPDDKQGSLQDVHWSHGSFGYFPTYSMGSLYAAQFFACAQLALPDLEAQIKSGNTTTLLQWLRTHIHAHGRFYNSSDLCKMVTGKALDTSYFISYVLEKYSAIYTL